MIEPRSSPPREFLSRDDQVDIHLSPLPRCLNLEKSETKETERDIQWEKKVHNFLITTTLHGARHLATSKPLQKCLWIIVMLLCGMCLISHTSFLFHNAWTRPKFSTTFTYEYQQQELKSTNEAPAFPGITLCKLSPLEANDYDLNTLPLIQYVFLSLGFPYSSLKMEDRSLLFDMMLFREEEGRFFPFKQHIETLQKEFERQEISKNLTGYIRSHSDSCSEVFSSCALIITKLNCCDIFKPLFTNIGLCYTLDISADFLRSALPDLPFTIELHNSEPKAEEHENGYHVIIHDHRVLPRLLYPTDGTLLSPGSIINMKIKATLTDYSARYASFLGWFQNCPQLKGKDGPYSLLECGYLSAIESMHKHCNCTWIIIPDEILDMYETKLCGPKEMTECFMKNFENIFGEAAHCQLPCIETVYEATVSYGELTQTRPNKKSRLTISYNGQGFYHNIYHRHYVSTLLSDIGGATGLLLGASAITGLELIIFFGQWVYCKILCRTS